MADIKTADRVVVTVIRTDSSEDIFQVADISDGFKGITSTDFSDNDLIHGFLLHEDGVQWEVYDFNGDDVSGLLQINNVTGTVTIDRPATPYASSNNGARISLGSGSHTLAIEVGSGSLARFFRETNPTWLTFTSGDATPSVANYRLFKTNGTTTITDFDGAEDGKIFYVYRGNADITIQHNAGVIETITENDISLTETNPTAFFVEDGGVIRQIGGGGGSGGTPEVHTFNGDSVTETFQIADAAGVGGANLKAFVGGLLQPSDTYALADNGADLQITFTGDAPPTGTNNIVIHISKDGVPVAGTIAASNVTYSGGAADVQAALSAVESNRLLNSNNLSDVSSAATAINNIHPNRQKNIIDDYGAVADANSYSDGVVSGTSFSSSAATFVAGDVGKSIVIKGAGTAAANHVTTIAAFTDASNVTLTDSAPTAVGSNARFAYGTENFTAFQNALDSGNYVRVPAGRYLIDTQLTYSDNAKLVGDAYFTKSRTGFDYMDHNPAVIIWGGASGSNTTPVRVSALAVGTEGTDFSAPGTDDLIDFRFEDIHIDAMGADYGVYYYRCANGSYVNNISVEDAENAGHYGLGLFTARWGYLAAYSCQNQGHRFGQDDYGWASGEASNFACVMDLYSKDCGQGSTFTEDSGTSSSYFSNDTLDDDGAGMKLEFGRGSKIRCEAEINDGRGVIITAGNNDAPVIYDMVYIEGNGAGPLVDGYTTTSRGIIIEGSFIHPGNGGALVDQTIKIAASSDDDGPADYGDWLLLRDLMSETSNSGFNVKSNTNKFKVENCSNIVFTDQYPLEAITPSADEDRLINGQFDVWQRGTSNSSVTSNEFMADRWQTFLSGGTVDWSRQDLTLGALPGLNGPEPKYFLRFEQTATSDDDGLIQKIDDVRTYSGKTVFVSFWAKSTGTLNLRGLMTQDFGTGGSPSSDVNSNAEDIVIDTAWRRYVMKFDVPSISGKTIGSNEDSFLRLRFYNTNSVTWDLDIACVQIDVGGVGPRSYRLRSEPEEFQRCLPYFQRIVSANFEFVATSGYAATTTRSIIPYTFPVPMRKTPTITTSSLGHFSVQTSVTSRVVSAISVDNPNRFSCEFDITNVTGLTAGDVAMLRASNASATFDLDAEI